MGGFVYRMAVIHKQSFNNILIQIQICIKAEILYFTHNLFFFLICVQMQNDKNCFCPDTYKPASLLDVETCVFFFIPTFLLAMIFQVCHLVGAFLC